jgi:glycosyltransferase involved in cell wall biosynthesis
VVYDVDGLRDSVTHGVTGLIARENTKNGLAEAIVRLLKNPEEYAKIRNNAYQASQKFTFDASYEHFFRILTS